MAFSFPEVTEEPHFEKTSFRVKKKIFLTYDLDKNTCTAKLSETDQDVYAAMSKGAITKVPNKWGDQGWTIMYLEYIPIEMGRDVIISAYCEVAPSILSDKVKAGDIE